MVWKKERNWCSKKKKRLCTKHEIETHGIKLKKIENLQKMKPNSVTRVLKGKMNIDANCSREVSDN